MERGYALTSILCGMLLEVLVCCSGFGVTILSSRTLPLQLQEVIEGEGFDICGGVCTSPSGCHMLVDKDILFTPSFTPGGEAMQSRYTQLTFRCRSSSDYGVSSLMNS